MKSIQTVIPLLIAICLCSSLPLHAQDLTKNAYSIIKNHQITIVCKSKTQSLNKESLTITILNEKGLEATKFVCNCDQFNSLKSFSGELFNASGKRVRKIKKSDLQRTEYSGSALSTDDYFFFYECSYPVYPFTVTYEWETECNDGVIGFTPFFPQTDYNQSIEKAEYDLEYPSDMECNIRVLSPIKDLIKIERSKGEKGENRIKATASNLAAIEEEPFSLPLKNLVPYVYLTPTDFVYDKTAGCLKDWQSFGNWTQQLLNGRDELTDAMKQRVHELTAHCKSDREKVKAIYDYLAKTTRYVSIQLGIGGFQPAPASEVAEFGFGDCKALSNYTKAMLKELGIPSTYTVISTTNSRLIPDFASANQMNHIILQVPLPQDTLWLECTNPRLPFGYIHQQIAGHDGLLITPEGGKVYRLPLYPDSLNTQNNKATVSISPTGSATITVEEISRLFQYDHQSGIIDLEPNKQKDALREEIKLTHAMIDQIKIKENKTDHPEITIDYQIQTDQYGHKTGNRLFIPTNIFRRSFYNPPLTTRHSPISIGYGYHDTDSIRIKIPNGYSVEGYPKSIEMKSKFGTFKSSISIHENEIVATYRLLMHKGVYPKDDYIEFIAFRKIISEQYSGKVVLKKDNPTQ